MKKNALSAFIVVSFIRGNHIYNPHSDRLIKNSLVSLTVIGRLCVDRRGIATYTSGFNQYVLAA